MEEAYETITRWKNEIQERMSELDRLLDDYQNNMRLANLEQEKLSKATDQFSEEVRIAGYKKLAYKGQANRIATEFDELLNGEGGYEKMYHKQYRTCDLRYKQLQEALNIKLVNGSDPSDHTVTDILTDMDAYLSYQMWLSENKYNKVIPGRKDEAEPGQHE